MKIRTLMLGSLIALLSGCIEVPSDNTAYVFESKNSVQCESPGITKTESSQKLIDIGVDVLISECAYDNLIDVMDRCGNPTSEIIVHKIQLENVSDAKSVGFYENPDFTPFDCE